MTANSASNELSITQIGQIAINVHDTSRAVEFYRDTLGLKLLLQRDILRSLNVAAFV